MGAVKDHQANTSLIELTLNGNNVGDAGAAAFGDALQATVVTCGQELFQSCVSCYHRCCFAKWCEQLASPCYCASCVCVLLLCFFLCLEGNDSLMRTIVKVDVARFQNRLE